MGASVGRVVVVVCHKGLGVGITTTVAHSCFFPPSAGKFSSRFFRCFFNSTSLVSSRARFAASTRSLAISK